MYLNFLQGDKMKVCDFLVAPRYNLISKCTISKATPKTKGTFFFPANATLLRSLILRFLMQNGSFSQHKKKCHGKVSGESEEEKIEDKQNKIAD
jgi:hypothetical protein